MHDLVFLIYCQHSKVPSCTRALTCIFLLSLRRFATATATTASSPFSVFCLCHMQQLRGSSQLWLVRNLWQLFERIFVWRLFELAAFIFGLQPWLLYVMVLGERFLPG